MLCVYFSLVGLIPLHKPAYLVIRKSIISVSSQPGIERRRCICRGISQELAWYAIYSTAGSREGGREGGAGKGGIAVLLCPAWLSMDNPRVKDVETRPQLKRGLIRQRIVKRMYTRARRRRPQSVFHSLNTTSFLTLLFAVVSCFGKCKLCL